MAGYFTWGRKAALGYEVSSKGDKRYSAFFANLPGHGNRTIEVIYQCDPPPFGKGWDPGGSDWRAGKGKPPKDMTVKPEEMWLGYLSLWWEFAFENMDLVEELYEKVKARNYRLTDMFANSDNNQARAWATILNELYPEG